VPVPVVVNATNVTPASAGSAGAAAGAAAKAAGGQGLQAAVTRALENFGVSNDALVAIVVAVLFAFLAYMAVRRVLVASVGRPLTRRVAFLVYDDSVPALRFYVMTEIAPNVFVTDDGKYIAFVSEKSRMINITPLPLDKKVRQAYPYAYYGHRIGSLVINMDPVEEMTLSVLGGDARIRRLSDILAKLYTDSMVADIRISPQMRLVLTPDPGKAAALVSASYGRHAEEALISIVSTTGRRKEFEQQLRAILEAEKERAESLASAATRIGFMMLVGMVALAYVLTQFR